MQTRRNFERLLLGSNACEVVVKDLAYTFSDFGSATLRGKRSKRAARSNT